MSLPGRSLRAATIVILALTFFGVLMSVYPIVGFSTQSVDKPIIPVWESGDEEQTAEQTVDDDTPIPTLSSALTQSETSGATETVIDPSTSEVVEAALRGLLPKGRGKQMRLLKGMISLALPLTILPVAPQTLYCPRSNLHHRKTLLLPPKILPEHRQPNTRT